MPITAQSFDGVQHQFPDGTDPSVIDKVMKEYVKGRSGQAEAEAELGPNTPYSERQAQEAFFKSGASAEMGAFPPGSGPIAESMGKGIITGVPGAILGVPGDTEAAAKAAINAVPTPTNPMFRIPVQATRLGLNALPQAPTTDTINNAIFGPPANQAEEAGRVLGTFMSAGPESALLKGGARAVVRIPGIVTGRTAAQTAEALRATALKQAENTAASAEAATRPAEAEVAKAQKIQDQLRDQPRIAEERARARALDPDKVTSVQTKVVSTARDRARDAEAQYRQAGATAEEARGHVIDSEARQSAAEQSVRDLEQRLSQQSSADPATFGAQVRGAVKGLADKFGKIRARESGFVDALNSAGNYERVPTKGIIDSIDAQAKVVKNPSLQGALGQVRELLTNEGRPNLTIRQADSLRKYLDDIIQSKTITVQNQARAVDKETLAAIREVKKSLVESATKSWPAYRDALSKWRTLSRPLDIVERKGALRKVLDTDPISTDYALTEAQVAGQIVKRAQEGSPVFTRLLAESPELKDAARLYFVRDLYGEGATPSLAKLKTWLKTNEAPLKQLGLYDDFRDMRVARETAQSAVDAAKGDVAAAKREAAQAAATQKEAGAGVTSAERLRAAAVKREEAARAAVRQPNSAAAVKRGEQATQSAAKRQSAATKQIETQHAVADRMRKFTTEIESLPTKEVASKAKAFFEGLRSDGILNDAQYAKYLKQVESARKSYGDSAAFRRHIVRAAGLAALLGAGWEARRVVRDLLP